MKNSMLSAALLSSFIATSAGASTVSFIGESLTITNDNNSSIETVTVGAGAEVIVGGFGGLIFSGESIDVADTSITFVFTAPLNIDFTFSGFSGVIESITSVSKTVGELFGTPTLAADGKSFTLPPQFDSNGGTVVYDVTWEQVPTPPAVPLPAGGALLLTALAGLGFARRK